MATAHQKLSVAIVLLALGGTIWSTYAAYKATNSARLFTASRLMVAVLGTQAIFGIVLAITGSRPLDSLHFVFGPAAILALPAAIGLGRGRPARTATGIVAAGWLVTLALSLRAVGTGGLG